MKFELHPLCALFPRMAGAEFEALKADIKANGLRQPIVTHQGMILDGGNRYAACMEVGIKPLMTEYTGNNLVTYVLSANFYRRHLSEGQQAAIVASATDWAKAQTHGGGRRGDQGATLHLETVAQRAAVSGASPRTQKTADKLVREQPALAQQVVRGEKSLNQAAKELKPPKASKPQPAKPAPVDPDDMATSDELLAQMKETQQENERLHEQTEIMAKDDKAAEIKKLLIRIAGLEGRLQQAQNQIKSSEDATKYHAAVIHKLRKMLGVEGHKEIIAAVKALVDEKAEA